MACEHCLNRRDFLAKSALAAAALVAAEACGDGQIGPPTHTVTNNNDPYLPPGGPVTVTLAQFPSLADTGVLVAIGKSRAVMRTGATTFIGLSRLCTHQLCEIDVLTDHFACPCHGSQFTSTGAVIHGPSTGESIVPLRQLAVTFDQAGSSITVE